VDGISFRRLPEKYADLAIHKENKSQVKSNSRNSSFDAEQSSRTGSGSWECSACTLVNEKPLAPVCEACGSPKPRHPGTTIVIEIYLLII